MKFSALAAKGAAVDSCRVDQPHASCILAVGSSRGHAKVVQALSTPLHRNPLGSGGNGGSGGGSNIGSVGGVREIVECHINQVPIVAPGEPTQPRREQPNA